MLFRGSALALLAAVCVAVPVASAASTDRLHPDPNVAGLQTALKLKGFYRGRIDGLRGPLTTAALQAFREKYRLASSNLIDRRARAALGPLGRHGYGTRFLRRGKVGLDVAALQFELRYHGFPAPATGVFGDKTKFAVARFQRFAGVVNDGVAGRATYAALAKPPPAVPRLRPPLPLSQHAKQVGTAVEITCPYAAAVAASIAGKVVFADNRPHGYGYTVVIRDGRGLQLLYAHLARIDVKAGDRLAAGAAIGLAGWTGKKRPDASLRVELRLRGARLDAYRALYGH
jgi:peptidoglycan hydrolase-like protein with peptidoglycan-binding domain